MEIEHKWYFKKVIFGIFPLPLKKKKDVEKLSNKKDTGKMYDTPVFNKSISEISPRFDTKKIPRKSTQFSLIIVRCERQNDYRKIVTDLRTNRTFWKFSIRPW